MRWLAVLGACREEGVSFELSLGPPTPNVLQGHLRVALGQASAVWAECTTGSDPLERHLVESPPAREHTLLIQGLLPDTYYDCVVHAGAAQESIGLRTGHVPLPPFVAEGAPSGAYTLFNTQEEPVTPDYASLVMVDPEGRPRWWYLVGRDLVLDLDAEVEWGEDGQPFVHVGGGWAHQRADQSNQGVFRDVDLAGQTRLERTAPLFGLGFNHHSERLDDGTYLSLTFHEESLGAEDWIGVGIEQWRPTPGDPVGELVWSWSTQPLVDEGVLAAPTRGSPYHPNSVSFVRDALGEAAWLSLYVARAVWRIDRETGALTHVFSPTGDFTLEDPTGAPLPAEEWTYVQHDPDWLPAPDGSDELRVLMYDNGAGRPVEQPYSRVVEYALHLEERRAVRLWSWTEPGWYNPVVGDADYLPNGHVLVAQGFNLKRTPDSDDTSEIVELRPPGEVVWRLTFTDQRYQLFRAQQYDGCALFANARYCEAVAERLDALSGG